MAGIQEILVVPHTHHDIGYTHTPTACLEAHVSSVGEAIRLCEAAFGDESATSFRWTFELSRPVLQFLKGASSTDLDRMRRLLAADRLAVTAAYLHMTQLVGHEEAIRSLWAVHDLRERFGLSPSIVQHGDINGLGWGTVPLMVASGLNVLVMALNPDHGRAPFEQPSAFYWEGPDGSRVLVWLSVHYGLGRLAEGRIDQAREVFPSLLARLHQRTDYPFDVLIVHAARDNMWPDARVVDGARRWNEQGHTPPMRIVTIETAIARVREQAARFELPVVRGEWADWWAHGHGSSAYEVGLGRRAQADLRLAETAHGLSRLAGAPLEATDTNGSSDPAAPVTSWYSSPILAARRAPFTDRVRRAYDTLLLWEEHTWGSFQSVTEPFNQFSQSHWNEKAGFGYQAGSGARELRRDALQRLISVRAAAPKPALVVVNPLSRHRDDVVTVQTDVGSVTRVVRGVPPLGIKVLPLNQPSTEVEHEQTASAAVLENRFYRLELDTKTASIVSLVDKELDKEWVDASAPNGLAAVVYEEADSTDQHPALTISRRSFHPDTPGPRFVRTAAAGTGAPPRLRRDEDSITLTYDASAPFLPSIRTSVTLYDDLKWIDLTVHLRKDENYRMEGVHIVFPFAAEHPEFLLETTNAVFNPASEQLPNTCRDWYSVQHALSVSDQNASVLWATQEAPLVQLGGFRTGAWSQDFNPSRGHVHAWLMNNLYFTNFKAAQGGEFDFSFRFTTTTGRADASTVRLWGELYAARACAITAPVTLGDFHWLEIAPDTVIAQVVSSMSNDGDIVLRLRETTGHPVTVRISWKADGEIDAWQVDLFDQPVGRSLDAEGESFYLPLRPHELTSVAIRRR
jgi:hypothetical protein